MATQTERTPFRRECDNLIIGGITESGEEPGRLRAKVTSRGGTTAAAIASLEQGGYFGLMRSAIEAACRRSAELGQEAKREEKT